MACEDLISVIEQRYKHLCTANSAFCSKLLFTQVQVYTSQRTQNNKNNAVVLLKYNILVMYNHTVKYSQTKNCQATKYNIIYLKTHNINLKTQYS